MSKILFLLSTLMLFSSCEQLVNIGVVPSSQKYPAKTGHEWEYYTEWKLEFYDTTGHIDSTSFLDFGNTVVRIVKEQDTIGTYVNLVLFESYDSATPQNIHRMWYMNNDSGLYAVAYSNPGASQPVFPKQNIFNLEQLKTFIKSFGILPIAQNFPGSQSNTSDSIQYYFPKRKVLNYPLIIGTRWIELQVPFFRERFINRQQTVSTNGKNYYCYKIESDWSLSNLEFNDYVDLNSGLIQREIIADSLMITTVTNPDSGAYARSTTISKLVQERNNIYL